MMIENLYTVGRYQSAWKYAAELHKGELMEGSDLPYIVLLGSTAAEIIGSIPYTNYKDRDLAVVCSLLFSAMEKDQSAYEVISKKYAPVVADTIKSMTMNKDIEDKKERLTDYAMRLRLSSKEARSVVLASRICMLGYMPKNWSKTKENEFLDECQFLCKEIGFDSEYFSSRLIGLIQYLKQMDGM